MLFAFVASPALSTHRPLRVSRHAPPRSQLSVSIFDLVASQDDTRLADLPALCQWVDGAGGDGLVAVEVESTPDHGLGLRTTQAVKRGDVLLSVPMTLALGAESVLRSSIGQWYATQGSNSGEADARQACCSHM